MSNQLKLNEFGFSEMYEWSTIPKNCRYGRIVQFNDEDSNLIQLAKNNTDIIGVTTINTVVTSDLSEDRWIAKYIFDEYGDFYMQEKIIAIGTKAFDNVNEFAYISTRKQKIYEQIEYEKFDPTKEYIPRNNRAEWIRVNLIGKCIVEDFGSCENSKYCKLYSGDDENLYGSVVPADENDNCPKWRILYRFSEKTLMIFFK